MGNLTKREFSSDFEMAGAVLDMIEVVGGCAGEQAVMLTGGSFAGLMSRVEKKGLGSLADRLTFLLSDERHVSDSSDLSNYKSLHPFVKDLGVETSRFICPDTRRGLIKCAQGYDADLKEIIQKGAVLQLAFLGLGKDGHFASLFGERPLEPAADFAVPVRMPDPPDRITVTIEFLWLFNRIVFIVPGRDKTNAVAAALAGENKLVNRLLDKAGSVEIWTIE